jgi:hypothetical protein
MLKSKQWMHTYSPGKLKILNKYLPTRKLMATVFWDRKGIHSTRGHSNINVLQNTKKTVEGHGNANIQCSAHP